MPGRWGLPPIVDVVIFAPVQWVSVRRALFCPQPECAPRVCAHRWVQRLPPRRSGWESSPSAPPNPRCGAARPRQWRPVAQSPRRSEGSYETPVARQSPDGCPPLDLQRSPAPARVPVCARALRRLLFCLHPPSLVWPSGCRSSRPAHLRRLLLRPPPSRASLLALFLFLRCLFGGVLVFRFFFFFLVFRAFFVLFILRALEFFGVCFLFRLRAFGINARQMCKFRCAGDVR